MEKLKVHLRLMKSFPKICGVLLFGVSIFMIYFGYLIFLGLASFDVLGFSSRVNYIFCAILMVTSYLLLTGASNSQQDESIYSLDKMNYSYQKNIYVILLIMIIIINLIMACVLIIHDWHNTYFLTHFLQPYLYNLLIPQVICLSIVFILSLFKNHVMHIVMLIIFIFMTSSFSEISWPLKPSFPTDKIYQFIHLPFELFYQNGEWGTDVMYGYQCELSRLWIFIMWGILLLSLYFIKMNWRPLNQSNIYKWGYKILLVLTVGSCFMVYLPESKYRINDAWDGYFYDIRKDRNLTEIKDEKINYKISEYDLTVSIKRMLGVEGKLHLESSIPRKDFILTLYQKYDLKELKSDANMTYQRKGDYIYIQFDQPISQIDLNIEYKGYHPIFYSNAQATMLPGYFSWYPMCGEKQIFITYEIKQLDGYDATEFGYNTLNHIDNAKITLHTDKDYITNLTKKSEHVYQGTSDSISLFDGYIESADYQNIISYLPLNGTLQSKKQYLKDIEDNYLEELEKIEKIFDVSMEKYRAKKIINVTGDISRNTNIGETAIFDDYIISSYMNIRSSILCGIVESSPKKTLLTYAMKWCPVQDDLEKYYQNLINSISNGDNNIDQIKKINAIVDKLGTKRFLHELYEYMFDDTPADDEMFLERMGSL